MRAFQIAVVTPLLMLVLARCQTPVPREEENSQTAVATAGRKEPQGIERDEMLYRETEPGPDAVEWFSGEFQDANPKTGIALGDTIPRFQGRDQHGALVDFDSVKGSAGALVLFHRSADWCPSGKAQLVQLDRAYDIVRAKGFGIAAISYDGDGALRHFAERQGGIRYPLISDPDSTIIRAFGILNENIPQGNAGYGIPFPGVFILDTNGVVQAKFFEANHNLHVTAGSMLIKHLGDTGIAIERTQTDRLTLTTYASDEVVTPGSIVTLVAEVELPEKMHLYAPGVENYRPTGFHLDAGPLVRIEETVFPESKELFLPAIGETVPVYEARAVFERDVALATSLDEVEAVTITGAFDFQACDDKVCYVPESLPLRFELRVEPLDDGRVPEEQRRRRQAVNP